MAHADGAPRPAVDRAVEAATSRPALVGIAVAIVAALTVTTLLGGFEQVERADAEERLEALAPGEWSASLPYSYAVASATRTDRIGYSEPDAGYEFVMVEADAVNGWDREATGLDDGLLLDLGDGTRLSADRVFIVADGSWASDLPPRVRTLVRLVWEVPEGSVGAEASLVVLSSRLVTNGRLITQPYWTGDRPVQSVAVPVADAFSGEEGAG